MRAHRSQQRRAVRYDYQRGAARHKLTQALQALLLKRNIAHRQRLIHQQHIRAHIRGHRKSKARHHAGGIHAQGRIHKTVQAGKLRNRRQLALHALA